MRPTIRNGSHETGPAGKRREDIRRLFNAAAQPLLSHAEPSYDEHMAAHYQVAYGILDDIQSELVQKGVKGALRRSGKPFRILLAACGTGKIDLHLFNQALFQHIQNGGAVEVVLLDASEEMLSVAARRFENRRLLLSPCEKDRFGIHPVPEYLEDITAPAVVNKYRASDGRSILAPATFDLVTASYLINWLSDDATRRQAYSNLSRLLTPSRRALFIEEHPLIVTPSTSVPDGLEDEVRAMNGGVSIQDFYSMLTAVGFMARSTLGLSRSINPGTEYEHRMHYAIFEAVAQPQPAGTNGS